MASDSVFGTPVNGDSVNLTRGMIVRVSATNAVLRAQADTDARVQALYGIVLSGVVGVGGPVNAAQSATRCPVLLETGLTPAVGQKLYVSPTVAGRCTNVAPAIPAPIGFIESVGSYSTDSLVLGSIMMGAVLSPSGVFGAKVAITPGADFTIGSLLGNTATEYEIELYAVNGTGGAANIGMLLNADPGNTSFISNGGDGVAPLANDGVTPVAYSFGDVNPYCGAYLAADDISYSRIRVICFAGSYRISTVVYATLSSAGVVKNIENLVNSYTDVGTEITSIKFAGWTGPVANLFASGSWYRIRAV